MGRLVRSHKGDNARAKLERRRVPATSVKPASTTSPTISRVGSQRLAARKSKPTGFKPVPPQTKGVNPAAVRNYERTMQKLVRNNFLPGCASVIFRDGDLIQSGAWGYADIERRTPFTHDTLCRLFCATKTYVAITFMTLVEEGCASLEDRLDKYIPAFKDMRVLLDGNKMVKANSPICLKHLLSHTSGIDYALDIGDQPENKAQEQYLALQRKVQRGQVRTLKDFVERLAKLPLSNHPGKRYYYGFSYDVLARVIEVISQKDLEDIMQERVFQPLGMTSTWWSVPKSELHRLAALYAGANTWGNLYGESKSNIPVAPRPGLVQIDGQRPEDSNWRSGQECAVRSGGGFMGYLHGGLVSTVADTVKFLRFMINKGVTETGQQLLKAETLKIMETDRLKDSWGAGRACYIGNKGVFRDGGNEVGMGGAACTYWSLDREDGIATAWFTQFTDMKDFPDMGPGYEKADLWMAMHKAIRKRPRGSASSAKRRRLAW